MVATRGRVLRFVASCRPTGDLCLNIFLVLLKVILDFGPKSPLGIIFWLLKSIQVL